MSDYPMTVDSQGRPIVDSSDAAWATYVAEGRAQLAKAEADQAETRHQLEMAKSAGLHALGTVQYDPDVLADARVLHNQNPAGASVAELIERVVIPIRERFLADFDSPNAPTTPKKVGANETAFNLLIGGGK